MYVWQKRLNLKQVPFFVFYIFVLLTPLISNAQTSRFEQYNLKYGISIEIPKHWIIINKQVMNQIDTNTEITTGVPQGDNEILIAANYIAEGTTLATARVSVRIKKNFSQKDLRNMTQSELDAGDMQGWTMAVNALKKMNDTTTKISKFFTTKETLASYICTHTQYQIIEPNKTMNTSIYVIYLETRAVKLTLSYDVGQAYILKPTIERIKQSLVVKN